MSQPLDWIALLFLLPSYAMLLAMFAPAWWPIVRLIVIAPLRRDKPKAETRCVLLYLIASLILSGGIWWLIAYKIPSGVVLIPFVAVSWLPLAFAIANDPLLKKSGA